MKKKKQRKSILATSVLTLTALLMVFAFMPIDGAFADTQTEDQATVDQLEAASEVVSDVVLSDDVITEEFEEGDVTEDIGELSAQEQLELKQVIDMIKALPSKLTLNEKTVTAITNAWAAYKALSAVQKSKISAALVDKLKQAKEAVEKYIDKQAVDKVVEMIKELPSKIPTSGAVAVIKVRDAYEKLTPEQQKLVPQSWKDLLHEAEVFFSYPDGESTYVSDLIYKLPANPTSKDAYSVYLAYALYEVLTSEQKAKIPPAAKAKLDNAVVKVAQWIVYDFKVKIASKLVPQNVCVKNAKSKKAVVTWKDTMGDGYEVWCSTSKQFKKGLKKKTIKDPKVTKATFKSLKKGKTYYVKVRTVSKVNNAAIGQMTTIKSNWSEVKSIKIKK